MKAYTESNRTPVTRDMGLTGRLLVGGALSTGLLLGGYTVAIMTLAGRMNGNAVLMTSMGLFLVGALIGLVVSAAAGLVGREDGVTIHQATESLAKGLLYLIPALMVGAMLAGWIGLAVIGVYLGKVAPVAGSAAAALIAAGVMVATTRLAWQSARNTARRVRQTI